MVFSFSKVEDGFLLRRFFLVPKTVLLEEFLYIGSSLLGVYCIVEVPSRDLLEGYLEVCKGICIGGINLKIRSEAFIWGLFVSPLGCTLGNGFLGFIGVSVFLVDFGHIKVEER